MPGRVEIVPDTAFCREHEESVWGFAEKGQESGK